MEAYGENYLDGFTDLTFSEFKQEYFRDLICNYVLEKCPEILEEEDFTDFTVGEYHDNLIKDYEEPIKEDLW